MVDSIHALNAKMMISVWPKFYMTTEHYKEFDEKGWMYQQAVKDSIRDWIGPGYVGSFDAVSARKLFWKKVLFIRLFAHDVPTHLLFLQGMPRNF